MLRRRWQEASSLLHAPAVAREFAGRHRGPACARPSTAGLVQTLIELLYRWAGAPRISAAMDRPAGLVPGHSKGCPIGESPSGRLAPTEAVPYIPSLLFDIVRLRKRYWRSPK